MGRYKFGLWFDAETREASIVSVLMLAESFGYQDEGGFVVAGACFWGGDRFEGLADSLKSNAILMT